MTALALALAFLGSLAFAAFVLHQREARALRAELRVQTVSVEDFESLRRSVIEQKADLEKVQARVAFGGAR